MTTIAFKDGVLAADSLVSSNGLAAGEFNKLRRVKGWDGSSWIIGFAGGISMFDPFCVFIEELREFDIDEMGFHAIAINESSGHVETYCSSFFPEYNVKTPFHALGTGADIALGAMQAGATAVDAVKVACKLDLASGGRVRKMEVKHDTTVSKSKGKKTATASRSKDLEEVQDS